MSSKPQTSFEERRDAAAAQDWLRRHYDFVNSKWKSVSLEFWPRSKQPFTASGGERVLCVVPAHYVLRYYRSQFRFFGDSERAEITFTEGDIYSVRYSADKALFDAAYALEIVLKRAVIDLRYSPPFFGVTPIASARHSENVSVRFDLAVEEETA